MFDNEQDDIGELFGSYPHGPKFDYFFYGPHGGEFKCGGIKRGMSCNFLVLVLVRWYLCTKTVGVVILRSL